MAMNIEELRRRFSASGVSFEIGRDEATCVRVDSPTAKGCIYLHGAHITDWQPEGHEPALFMSDAAVFAPGKAIRGGVPICHPWFGPATLGPRAGDAAAPAHGLVRTREWTVEKIAAGIDGVTVVLSLAWDETMKADWPWDFLVRLSVKFGKALLMTLETTNRSAETMVFEEALHTYLAIAEIGEVAIDGLDGAEFLDKTDGLTRKSQKGTINFAGETDRAYVNTVSTCVLRDAVKKRAISVAKSGSQSTIIWNPAEKRASQLKDIGVGQWPRFACIETANVGENRVSVLAGQTHVMTAEVEVMRVR